MSYESNIYYHPENYDLETVGTVQWREPEWDFDLTVVWRDSKGMFYWASDSGCSCPSPFEDISFDSLDRGSAHDAAEMLSNRLNSRMAEAEAWDYYKPSVQYASPQVADVIGKIMQ